MITLSCVMSLDNLAVGLAFGASKGADAMGYTQILFIATCNALMQLFTMLGGNSLRDNFQHNAFAMKFFSIVPIFTFSVLGAAEIYQMVREVRKRKAKNLLLKHKSKLDVTFDQQQNDDHLDSEAGSEKIENNFERVSKRQWGILNQNSPSQHEELQNPAGAFSPSSSSNRYPEAAKSFKVDNESPIFSQNSSTHPSERESDTLERGLSRSFTKDALSSPHYGSQRDDSFEKIKRESISFEKEFRERVRRNSTQLHDHVIVRRRPWWMTALLGRHVTWIETIWVAFVLSLNNLSAGLMAGIADHNPVVGCICQLIASFVLMHSGQVFMGWARSYMRCSNVAIHCLSALLFFGLTIFEVIFYQPTPNKL